MKVLAILLLCAVAVYARPDRPGERIDEIHGFGEVVGVPYNTHLGNRYYVYNIKYASIDYNSPYGVFTGHCKSWTGEYNTYDADLPHCYSMTIRTKYLHGDRPVVVLFGGKDFVAGSHDEYLLENFLEKDYVVVSIPYQGSSYGSYGAYGSYGSYSPYDAYGSYGPYGSYGSYGPYGLFAKHAPGYYGHSDSSGYMQALKWIKTYINQFGGDVNRITFIGNHKLGGFMGTPSMNMLPGNLLHQMAY